MLNSFERAFYKTALTSLESHLINYSKLWTTVDSKRQDEIRDSFYKELKCYLMLSQPSRLEPDYVVPLLQQIIQERLVGYRNGQELSDPDNQHLSELLQVYLSHMLVNRDHPDYIAPFQPNSTLITEIQTQLKAMPDAGRLYAQILNKGKLKSPPIPLEDMINGPGQGILTSKYQQPFMFTADGWRSYVQPEIENLVHVACQGDWVTGYLQDSDPSPKAPQKHTSAVDEYAVQLEMDIRALYFADYVDSWLNLIDQIQLNNFTSLDDAAKIMLMVARNDGPYAELLQVVSKNINITQAGGLATGTGTSTKTASLIPELNAPLHDLRKLTDPGDKMTTSLPINQYLLALTSAQSGMEQMAAAVEVHQESFRYASAILGGTGTTDSELYKCWLSTNSLLNGMDARTRKVAEHLLYEPIKKAWIAIIRQTQNYLQNQWTSSVLVHYKGKISEKFPFSTVGDDASLNDVSDFFRPDEGVIWAFTEEQLKPFLRKKRNGWTEKTWLGSGLNFDHSLLNSLAQASLISSGMFQHGEPQPDVLFSIFPIPSKGLRVVHFESNGQKMIYQNEPQEWKPFRWPGDKQTFGALIGAIPSGTHSMITRKYSGDWSLFHLLQDATSSDQGIQYNLSWELKNEQELPVTVQLTLRPDRQNNIFAKGLFSTFRLPSQIF
jgi:type VI secretion system protein ImpL